MQTSITPLSIYDVVIIYSDIIAQSAANTHYRGMTPFPRTCGYADRNTSYAYFLTQCARQGLTAAFATTQDANSDGTVSSVWTYNKRWQRKKIPAIPRFVFDKFSIVEIQDKAQKDILTIFIQKNTLFQSPLIRTLFDDKLNTFEQLKDFSVPTVSVDLSSKKRIRAAFNKLQKQTEAHPYTSDFDTMYVLKDRFGAGGNHIFKVHSVDECARIGKKYPHILFILQPLIDASGFVFKTDYGIVDLRAIMCDGKIIQSYIRIPKSGDFRANASQGGRVVYIPHTQIPREVTRVCARIHKTIGIRHAFYALDFIKSKAGNLYCIEGNSAPGLNWFDTQDEKHVKQLVRVIVANIKKRLLSKKGNKISARSLDR